ncbi:hypothetical protein V8C86DRAFT_2597688 [Haematococcus lacustris]
MAEMIRVTVVNEDGESIRAQPVVLKPDPPISCQAVITLVQAGGVGQGFLLQEGVTLRLDDWVTAGNYTYCLTAGATTQAPAHVAAGRLGVGEATLTRNLASQTEEIQVVLHEAEVRSTAHFEEMKQEMKQEMKLEMKREMERQMKRLQAQLLEGAVPNRKQAFVRLGVFFACWVGAFWIELRSPHRFEWKMLLDHTPVLMAMVAMFGVLLVPKMKLRATLYRYLSGPLESSMGSAR